MQRILHLKHLGIGKRISARCLDHRAVRPACHALLTMSLLLILIAGTAGEAAASIRETLAVTRAGGVTLYDAPGGKPLQDLPMGEALSATGRTVDGQWVTVVTRGGSAGWAPTERLVIFGVGYLPVSSDWTDGGGATTPWATAAATDSESAMSSTDKSGRLTGSVTDASLLNVRAGPGTIYPIIDRVASGETITAMARNPAADWVQIDRPDLSGGFGWVSGGYLSLNGGPETLPVSDEISDESPLAPARQPSSRALSGLAGRLIFQESSGQTIYVYDLASGALRSLAIGADPAIDPDGRTVAFWRDEDGQHALYLIDIDGGNERRILSRGEKVRAPGWSPDGGALVFSRVVGRGACRDAGYGFCLPDVFPYNQTLPLKDFDKWGLTVIDRDGNGFRDLASTSNAFAPDWGDGGIVYDSGAGLQITGARAGDDANAALLTDRRVQDPAWQPGGSRIVFHSLEKDHWEIFIANADGSDPVALTRPATTLVSKLPHNVAPAWSPDGQSIVFLSNRTGDWAFWIMDAGGSNQRQLPVDVPIEYRYQGEQVVSWGESKR